MNLGPNKFGYMINKWQFCSSTQSKSANYASSAFGNENCARYDVLCPKIMLTYIKAKTRDVTQLYYTLRDAFWLSDDCLPLMEQANEYLVNFLQAIGLFDTKNINCGKEQESGKLDSLQVTQRKVNIVSWLVTLDTHAQSDDHLFGCVSIKFTRS